MDLDVWVFLWLFSFLFSFLFIWEMLAFCLFVSVWLLYIYSLYWVVGLFMLLNTSSILWNNSNLFVCHILNLKIQNFSSWLLPSVPMIEIENVGVWWTSQLFKIASFDSRLPPAAVCFQLLPLLAFFHPILLPQQVSASLTLPRYFSLTPICVGCVCHLVSSRRASEPLSQHYALSSRAIRRGGSRSRG